VPDYDEIRQEGQQRTTVSPVTAQRQPADPAGGVLALQGLAGNRAVTNALTVQREASAASQLDGAVGGVTSGHRLSASATIAGGQELGASDGKVFHTNADTKVTVEATDHGLSIDFSPSLTITKVDAILGFLDVDVDLTRLRWDFASQELYAAWSANRAVNWFGGVGDELLNAMREQLKQLPERTKQPGYNPFADPDLGTTLADLAKKIGGGGSGKPSPRMSGAEVQGEFTMAGGLTRDVGHGVTLEVPAGAHLGASASLAGDVPDSADKARIATVRLTASGGGLTLNLKALGQNWPVVNVSSVTLTAGGHLSAVYTLEHEAIGTDLLRLVAGVAATQNPLGAGEIRDDLTVHHDAAHQLIDKMVQDNVEPALRDAIRANPNAIPGVNLAQVLGL
jgi:hypothetical protein